MPAPIKHMTPDQIRNRLDEISRGERAHAERDFDAELAKVLRDGGDVDAIENAQMEAERIARRFRAEKAALTAELPHAIKRDGCAQIDVLRTQHQKLAGQAQAMASEVHAAWLAFSKTLGDWADIEDAAHEVTRQAAALASKTGADMPAMGTFQSSKLLAVLGESRDAWRKLQAVENEMMTVMGLQGVRID